MSQCDVCSKRMDRSALVIVPGSRVVRATARGFVPKNVAKESAARALFGSPSGGDAQLWQLTVSGNQTSDWGLCTPCAAELDAF